MYLKRYHDIPVSESGIWRILKRLDMNRLPASQRYKRHVDRWKRYEKAKPGHRVQIDVKFVAPLKGSRRSRYYQFTAIDDCTRLRVLRLYGRLSQKTAIESPTTTCSSTTASARRLAAASWCSIRRGPHPGCWRRSSQINASSSGAT